MIRVLVILLLLAIVGSLFSGLFYLYRDRGAGEGSMVGEGRSVFRSRAERNGSCLSKV